MTYTFVVGNGTSNRRWKGVKLTPSIGCNLGIKDWDFDHLICADRMAVAEIRKLPNKPNTNYWLKKSTLEVPPGWNEMEFPGIDSGSAALKLAAIRYPNNPIIVIGFDGVLNISNENAYTYPFRKAPTAPAIRERHRQSVLDLLDELPPVQFVSFDKDPELETICYDHAFKIAITQSRSLS